MRPSKITTKNQHLSIRIENKHTKKMVFSENSQYKMTTLRRRNRFFRDEFWRRCWPAVKPAQQAVPSSSKRPASYFAHLWRRFSLKTHREHEINLYTHRINKWNKNSGISKWVCDGASKPHQKNDHFSKFSIQNDDIMATLSIFEGEHLAVTLRSSSQASPASPAEHQQASRVKFWSFLT